MTTIRKQRLHSGLTENGSGTTGNTLLRKPNQTDFRTIHDREFPKQHCTEQSIVQNVYDTILSE